MLSRVKELLALYLICCHLHEFFYRVLKKYFSAHYLSRPEKVDLIIGDLRDFIGSSRSLSFLISGSKWPGITLSTPCLRDKKAVMNSKYQLAGNRVLFVFPSLQLGGAERQGLHLARYLKSIGCDVRVWGHHGGSGLVMDHCDEAGIPWAIHRFRWPCRKSSLVRDFIRILWALHRDRPDVILTYTKWANVSCGLTWRWSPAKVCIWGQRDIHWLSGDVVERFAYRRASAVICNAAHMIDYLRQTLGDTSAPMSVVHNGINLAPCLKSGAEWRADLGIDEAASVATMVANFKPEKDHATLLHAWSKVAAVSPDRIPRPILLLAGAPLETYASTRQLASNLGILDSVIFLDQVKDISGLLAASDIGILISKSEGLSNSVIEYMASGLPVVATDLPANREALGDEMSYLFCGAADVDSLATRILSLLQDSALRKVIGAHNRQRALTEFSVKAMCEKMVALIGDLLQVAQNRD